MGHDISVIGNHDLNTVSIVKLASDLLSRLDINIVYGYYGEKEYHKLLGKKEKGGFVLLGSLIKNKNFKNFILIDDDYQSKELIKNFGIEILYKPEYWLYNDGKIPDNKFIEAEIKRLSFCNYDLSSHEYSEYLTINREHYNNDIPYYARWWDFCRSFTDTGEDDEWYLKNLNNFRRELKFYTEILGGNEVYYLDDQSYVLEGVGQGEESEINWNELKMFVRLKAQELLLDIPKYFTDKTYREEFVKKKKMPLAFIDDFRDFQR